MGVRRQAREAALQAFYMCDALGDFSIEHCKMCLEHFATSTSVKAFALELCQGLVSRLADVDAQIVIASENWSLHRMARVDRSLLRLATYELLFFKEVPVNVAINEAIEIARRYSTNDAPNFINGVLDKVANLQKNRLQIEVVLEEKRDTDVNPTSVDLAALTRGKKELI